MSESIVIKRSPSKLSRTDEDLLDSLWTDSLLDSIGQYWIQYWTDEDVAYIQYFNSLTLIVTVMNFVIINSSTMWMRPSLVVCVTRIFIIKPYPLHTDYRPFHLLAFSGIIS